MSAEETFATFKSFIETRTACQSALRNLRSESEVSVIIGEMLECAVFQREGTVLVERRPAQNPELVLYVRPETIYVLNNDPTDHLKEIGLNLLKEILAGNIRIRVAGNLVNLVGHPGVQKFNEKSQEMLQVATTQGMTALMKLSKLFYKQ